MIRRHWYWLGMLAIVATAHARRPDAADAVHPCVAHHPPRAEVALDGATAIVEFSPAGGAERLLLSVIDGAQRSILVQAYGFTDWRLLRALERAHRRGVDVRVILDRSDAEYEDGRPPPAEWLHRAGIPVWIDDTVRIAHNKVMVIDGDGVVTGSYNFTYSAQDYNAENLIYIRRAPALAAAYTGNWNWRRDCARPYRG